MKKLLSSLIILFLLQSTALACPMCKEVMKGFNRLTEGYFWSILLMLAVPFTLVGVFTGFLVRSYRRSRQ